MKRLRLRSLLAAVAVLVLTAFTSASAVANTSAQPGPTSCGLPAGKFLLIGDIARPQFLDVSSLRRDTLPQQTVTVTFRAGGVPQTHTYKGPLLLDVLTQAEPRFDPAIRNDRLRYFASVSATDCYRALVAYGEIDPNFENKKVLLAHTEDDRPLDAEGPRLVVPGDIAGGRYVTNVNRVYFAKPPL